MTPDLTNPDDRERLCAEDDAAIATFLLQHAGQYQEESPCARIVTTTTPTRLRVTTRTATAPPPPSTRLSPSAAPSASASSSGRSAAWLLVDGFAWLIAFALLAGFVLAAERLGGV